MYYHPIELAIGAGMFAGFLGGTVIAGAAIGLIDWKTHKDETALDSTDGDSQSAKSKTPEIAKKSWLSLLAFWFIIIAATIIATFGYKVFEQANLLFLNLLDLSSGEPNPINFAVIVLLYNACAFYFLSRHFKFAGLAVSFILANSFWWFFYSYMSHVMQGLR